ncbi:predicted protein [Lichtheimia corymbifera JMRC:FSU:9682]|uniref:Fork-head domain-containing protein n=2 Tax=Lichtheimia corymbifera JMRC:FSU:9682 TaxID=1263082 RepID=A0A068RHI2_9FUNG|nr:predicted protein [Lichtheimia corymbifera JMRC:FSU:9682]
MFPVSWKVGQQQQQELCTQQNIADSTTTFSQTLPQQYYVMSTNASSKDMAGFRVRQHPPPPYLQQPNQYNMPPHAHSPMQQPNAYPNYNQSYAEISNHPVMMLGNPSPIMVPKPAPRKRRRPPHSYASLIAQAILTSPERRLTLRDIYDWIQSRYPNLYEANETGWQVNNNAVYHINAHTKQVILQNTIRHNLSLNRCFMKIPRPSHSHGDGGRRKKSKGSYWSVDLEKLSYTNFGKQIMDTGFLGNMEYWQHQQMIEDQRQQQQRSFQHRQHAPSVQSTHSALAGFNVDSFIDVTGGGDAASDHQHHNHPSKRQANMSISDSSISPSSTTSSNMSTLMMPSSSSQAQTYSSIFPNNASGAEGGIIDSNGTTENNNFNQSNAFYPSSMHVHNIIN